MKFFSRKPTPVETFRAAEANLSKVEAEAPRDMLLALRTAGVQPGQGHPLEFQARERVAAAKIALAQAQQDFDASDPELSHLVQATDAALDGLEKTLTAVVDPAEPTIESTPQARELFQRDKAERAKAVKANADRRTEIELACLKSLRGGSDSLSQARSRVESAEQEIALIVDPAPPQCGRVCSENVSALSSALATHRAEIEANARRRDVALSHFAVVVASINAGFNRLVSDRQAAGLPPPSLFSASTVRGYYTNRGHLEAHAKHLTLDEVRAFREALGTAPVNTAAALAELRSIAGAKKAWEEAEKLRAEERKRYASEQGARQALVPAVGK